MDLDSFRRRLLPCVRKRFGAETTIAGLVALAGDASTRRYVRVRLLGGNAPATVVVMVLEDRGVALASEELGVVPASAELPFLNVQRFLRRLGVAVPEVYVDASGEGLVVLEDVGDAALRAVVDGAEPAAVERYFRQAIDQLLRIQLEGTRQAETRCIAFRQVFDERLYSWEFEHFIEYGIERRLGRLHAGEAAQLRSLFGGVIRRLANEPRYLSHRDYHAWNLFVHEDAIRVLDFQDALLATAPYDLATLLGDRDTPSIVPAESEKHLLEYYRCAWRDRGGQPWSADHLEEVYCLCGLQKAFKVIGRFHYLAMVKGKPSYRRYLPATVAQLTRLLERVAEGPALARVLQPYLPCLA